ncbi:MAG: hypothetical protein CMQ38_05235 [Gammaproteobacteria bacterium]|nr:hypothetical protein [Gammaproteobacteria bacterium]|tara:strand:- start:62847 stop:63323 length:477 start_codon:yes stop_codon:yes gene_type:complete
MADKLTQFWSALQQRERRTILAGALLILLAALYLIFDSIWVTRSALMDERADLLAEQTWMQDQAELAVQLQNNCRDLRIMSLAARERLNLLVNRNNLTLQNLRVNDDNYSFELRTEDGNNILQFIHHSACQGFSLSALTINREAANAYLGRVEFHHEG